MKDPACLFYIDTWLSATAEMDSDVRGWYLNLILHQYDKKDLPNDVEKLAVLANVKFSEFERFKHVLEHVLMQKFKLNEQNRLENGFAKNILEGRERFKEIRTKSGNIGVVIKIAKTIKGFNNKYIEMLKQELFTLNEDEINKHKDKHVLEHVLKLYINGSVNGDKDLDNNKEDEQPKELHFLQRFIIDKLKNVKKIPDQLTPEQCEKLIKEYGAENVKEKLLALENYRDIKKYTNLYLTLRTWCKPKEPKQEFKLPYHKKN
jgi:hypothetical protein